jgi:hypothetical protein
MERFIKLQLRVLQLAFRFFDQRMRHSVSRRAFVSLRCDLASKDLRARPPRKQAPLEFVIVFSNSTTLTLRRTHPAQLLGRGAAALKRALSLRQRRSDTRLFR